MKLNFSPSKPLDKVIHGMILLIRLGCQSMPRPYPPLAIANYFIERFGQSVGIEHMKLQKLVYCAHGWWVSLRTDVLVNERPQVWKHGPVFRSMYHVLKPFGHNQINTIQSTEPFSKPDRVDDTDEAVHTLLDWVWQRYGHLSSLALSRMTHAPGTSWSKIAQEYNYSVPQNLEIPDDYIREEFKAISKQESGRL